MNRRIAMLKPLVCVALVCLASCAERATVTAAPPAPVMVARPSLRYPCFQGEELGGLVFRVNQIAASSSLQTTEDSTGVCTADRRVVVSGTVTDPTGSVGYRVTRFEVERMTDQDGRNLLSAGVTEVRPLDGRGAQLHRPAPYPGNTSTEGFTAQVSSLNALPTELSELRGRVYAEVPGEVKDIDVSLSESGMIEPAPGLKVRIRRYREDRGTLTAQLEYTLDRAGSPAGKAPPIVLCAAILNEEREVMQEHLVPQEHVARNTVIGVMPIRMPLTPLKPAILRLQVSVDVREVCYEFAAAHVQLAR